MAYVANLPGPPPYSPAYEEELPLYEKVLIVLGLLVLLSVIRGILPGGGSEDDRTAGSPLFQLISGGVFFSAIGLLIIRGIPHWAFRLLTLGLPLVLLTALTLVSTIWSQAPEATFRRAVALLLGTSFAFYLVVRLDLKTFFNLLFIAFGIFLVVSLAAIATGSGITSGGAYDGSWRGISGNKNNFGRTVSLLVAFVPVAAVLGLITWRRTALLVALLGLAALVLSKSATSLVTAFASVGMGLVVYALCGGRIFGARLRGGTRAVMAILAVIAGFVTVLVILPYVLEALGRDPTLTGRTKLWAWSIDVNKERWLLGSGYRSFWIDENTRYFFEAFAWSKDADGNLSDSFAGPTHAHSGYVDIWLELGLVGAIAYAMFVISALAMLSRAVARGHYRTGYILAVMIAFIHIYAVTARSILQQSEEVWFLLVVFYLFTVKTLIFPPATTPSAPKLASARRDFVQPPSGPTTALSQFSRL